MADVIFIDLEAESLSAKISAAIKDQCCVAVTTIGVNEHRLNGMGLDPTELPVLFLDDLTAKERNRGPYHSDQPWKKKKRR